MLNQFSREEILIGKGNVQKLANSTVAIFGIGGVGSYVAEGLARAGIGNFILVDNDKIDITNINRQIHATMETVGQNKVDVMKKRILDINLNASVETYCEFYTANSDIKLNDEITYVVDAIDNVASKIDLIEEVYKCGIPIISSMGMGNKLDATKIEVTDIYKTSVCPLAKTMRKELKKIEISDLKVVYSKEEPIKPSVASDTDCKVGSVSFVPSVAGLIIAGEVVKDIINFT